MTTRVEAWNKEEAGKVQACLARLLSSAVFAQAERQKRLLS